MRPLVLALLCGCAQPITRAEPPPPEPPPPPVMPWDGDLLPGTRCNPLSLPSWSLDGGSVGIVAAGFRLTLPAGWNAQIPRRDLVVVTAPSREAGIRPVFELFVSPVCKSYRMPEVHGRMAARGLAEQMAPERVIEQVGAGRWRAGLGGRVGRGVVMDVVVETPAGPRALTLWATDLADSASFAVHAAAVCPTERKDECEDRYFGMLGSEK